jgi:hypothetical protein
MPFLCLPAGDHVLTLLQLFEDLQPAMDELVPVSRRHDENEYATEVELKPVSENTCGRGGMSGGQGEGASDHSQVALLLLPIQTASGCMPAPGHMLPAYKPSYPSQ